MVTESVDNSFLLNTLIYIVRNQTMLTLHSGRASRVVQLAGLNELGESIRML
jgi:hypothetical protein